ncbi:DUF2087 domain-containing protein [Paenibacillus sp. SYP-B3998]|uniref:DUF2087 domain-containing protein n=1 Tax=Paenibacillus sp. SYP-B3998 TaxID=2678564 RepID=A0A6G3ZX35_9BACL|nr:DUF2087 domain-containing protein [Paenibacillus sp. SYP-B3998]NEW06640.1 DUF2087 domain-containing protein [Paenibacillus sp. SYP-B3998]
MEVTELFWQANLDELKQGYVREGHYFTCLLCGKRAESGIIYPEEGVLYEAEKYMHYHIQHTHQSVFHYLIGLDKKLTGLTEHQNSLLKLFFEGKSDGEIQKEMGIGSASTIRNHRFGLKEKERQAKVFLAMMELLKEKDQYAPAFVDIHKTATMVDERYNVTQEEYNKIVKKYFPEGPSGAITTFSQQEKHKLVVLREIAKHFEPERRYKEKEVNEILEVVYHDYVTVRRYLIEYGFLDRKEDGSQYWLLG